MEEGSAADEVNSRRGIRSDTRKLASTFEKLRTETALSVAGNESLRRVIRIEKNRITCGKPLFDELGVNDDAEEAFFIPNNIQVARDRQIIKDRIYSRPQVKKRRLEH